jgi:hypothetical protein
MNTLYKTILSSALISLSVVFSNAQSTIIIGTNYDATVGFHDNYNSANVNGGNDPYFKTFWAPGNSGGEQGSRSLIYFDLDTLPDNITISSATLNLHGSGPWGSGDVGSGHWGDNEASLKIINEAWDEMVVTWNTQPATIDSDAVSFGPSNYVDQDFDVDVLPLVMYQLNHSSTSFGFELGLVTEEPTRAMAFFSSDEENPDNRPTLTVTYIFTGLQEKISDSKFSVYPNPSNGTVTFTSNDLVGTLYVYDIVGKEILHQVISTLDITISDLPTGLLTYWFVAENGATITKKLVVIR